MHLVVGLTAILVEIIKSAWVSRKLRQSWIGLSCSCGFFEAICVEHLANLTCSLLLLDLACKFVCCIDSNVLGVEYTASSSHDVITLLKVDLVSCLICFKTITVNWNYNLVRWVAKLRCHESIAWVRSLLYLLQRHERWWIRIMLTGTSRRWTDAVQKLRWWGWWFIQWRWLWVSIYAQSSKVFIFVILRQCFEWIVGYFLLLLFSQWWLYFFLFRAWPCTLFVSGLA